MVNEERCLLNIADTSDGATDGMWWVTRNDTNILYILIFPCGVGL
jgi:hypothetical protein